MKKLLFGLIMTIPIACHAGTRTSYFSPQGLIYISSTPFVAAINLDTTTTSGFISGSSPLTFNVKIGGGRNRALFVGCGQRNTDTITGVTAGGISMVLVDSGSVGSATYTSYIYDLLSPPSGTQAIAVSAGSGVSDRTQCSAISYSGVSQTNPVDVSSNTQNYVVAATSAAVTLVTTGSNEALFDFFMDGCNADTLVANPPQNPILESTWASFYAVGSSSMTAATSGSYTMAWGGITCGSALSNTGVAVNPSLTP